MATPPVNSAPVPRFPPRSGAWRFPLLALFLLVALFSVHLINDSDVGFHLAGGRWILEHHRVPSLDPYTYTVPDHPYLDIHWLYQALLYLLYRAGGFPFLVLAHAALFLATFFLLLLRLRLAGAPAWLCAFLLSAALFACEIRFRTRPEAVSWLLLSLTLWVLEQRDRRGRDLLFLLPFLQLVWVNVEGLFMLGWGVLGIHALSGYLEDRAADTKLLKYIGLSLAADLVNPYFLSSLAFPLTLLAHLGGSSVFKQGVREFQSPWILSGPHPFAHSPDLWVYRTFSLLLLALFLATFRQRRAREWLLALTFFGLSASAMRNIPLFLIACLPLAAACWRVLDKGFTRKASSLAGRPLAAALLALFLLGMGLRVATGAYYVSCERTDRFGLGLDDETEALKACGFLSRNRLEGRVLNSLDAGDWLDWAGPARGTFIDGRLEVMGKELFSEYSSAYKPGGLAALAAQTRADIILFNIAGAGDWVSQLDRMPGWRPVYLDASTAVYLRKGFGDRVPTLDFNLLPAELDVSPALAGNAPSILAVRPPGAGALFGEDFLRPLDYPGGLVARGVFCAQAGHPRPAELYFLEAVRRTQGRYPDFYLDLGGLYYLGGKYGLSRYCVNRVLEKEPRNPQANRIMDLLPRR